MRPPPWFRRAEGLATVRSSPLRRGAFGLGIAPCTPRRRCPTGPSGLHPHLGRKDALALPLVEAPSARKKHPAAASSRMMVMLSPTLGMKPAIRRDAESRRGRRPRRLPLIMAGTGLGAADGAPGRPQRRAGNPPVVLMIAWPRPHSQRGRRPDDNTVRGSPPAPPPSGSRTAGPQETAAADANPWPSWPQGIPAAGPN